MHCWLSDSLRRFYPRSPMERRDRLDLHALKNERVSFQMLCRTGAAHRGLTASVSAPEGLDVRVRHVGYVPMPHFTLDTPADELDGVDFLPGLAPDPLFPVTSVVAGPWETTSFWVSVHVAPDAPAGTHELRAAVATSDGVEADLVVRLAVHDATLPARRDFPVTHWFYADAILDHYRVALGDDAFWTLLDPYFRNLVSHGQDTLYVPIITPPLEGFRRPVQLLGISRDGEVDGDDARYRFDWSWVRRWVDLAKSAGIERFEWAHLFTQWGAAHAPRVYADHGEDAHELWPPETPAMSETYRTFLRQFLPAFERFLRAEDLLDRSFFHLSDEPAAGEHLANYRAARSLLRELAPWMTIMDALSEVEFAREGLVDTPVAILPEVPAFTAEQIPVWAYFCCVPTGRYLNRALDTPLSKIRMAGPLFYWTGVGGFLHWGYNFWYASGTAKLIDPFMESNGRVWPGWPAGDPFVVYPGPDGPFDSLRWEVFAESLQDYALFQAAAIPRDDPLFADVKDFADFPRGSAWLAAARAEAMRRLVAS